METDVVIGKSAASASASASVATSPQRVVRRIEPSRGLIGIDPGEIWRYRSLLRMFLWRDIKGRYRQTYLGSFWAFLRPFSQMVLMSLIFGNLAGFDQKTPKGIPYPLYLYSGILIWTYFSSAITGVTSSILNNAGLLSKVYFPRVYAPLSALMTPITDFAIAFAIVFGLFGYYGRLPSWHLVFLPFFVLLCMVAALAFGLWLTGPAVKYRDVPFAVPYAISLWFYVTPVVYPVTVVPERYRWLLGLNPMSAVLDGVRWSVLGVTPPNIGLLAISVGVSVVLVAGGLLAFRRTERTIVDMF